jgi:hypothetical protein
MQVVPICCGINWSLALSATLISSRMYKCYIKRVTNKQTIT